MRKVILSVATVVALVVGSATAFADGPAYQQPGNGMAGSPTAPTQSAPTPSSSQTNQAQITIQNHQFTPANLTVWQGTTVTWANQDTTNHTVTSDDTTGSVRFDSGTLMPGQQYSYTFSQTGMYTYHCTIHPDMTGSITVMSQPQQPASSMSSQPSASAQASASATVNNYSCSSGKTVQKAASTTAPPSYSNSSFPNYSQPVTIVPGRYVKTAVTAAETTEALPSTGPAGTIFYAATATVLGTGGYYIYLLRRKKSS